MINLGWVKGGIKALFTNSWFSDDDTAASASMEAAATFVATVPADETTTVGAGYKPQWTPIRTAETPEVRLSAVSKVRTRLPETYNFTTIAETPFIRVAVMSRVAAETPETGVMVAAKTAKATSAVNAKRPSGHANTPFVRAVSNSRVNWLPPIPEVVVMPVSIRRRSHYSYWTPETVQNPTEEMILTL